MILISPITVGNPTLLASQFNDHEVELEGLITSSGQTLNQAITNQQSKAAFIYSIGAPTFGENSPAANLANLTPWTGASGLQIPDAYSQMNGALVSFYHSIPSTTTSTTGFTVNIGQTTGTYLGGKYLVMIGGGAIAAGAVYGYTEIRYNVSSGYWELIQSGGMTAAPSRNSTVLVAASNATPKSIMAADYVCPGTADDVTIQSAITYLSGLTNGGSLVLSEGTFYITTNIVVASNVNISGQGNATILRRMSASLAQVIQVNNAVVNFKLSNFTIDGNGGTYTPTNAYGINCTNNTSNTGSIYDSIQSTGHTNAGGGTISYAFNNCVNMTNCIGTATAATASNAGGFWNCNNLVNCVGTGNGTGTSSGYGFYGCNYLTNCTGIGTASAVSAWGAGMSNCNYITNSTGKGTNNSASGYGTGFAWSNSLTNCFATGISSAGNGTAYINCTNVFYCQSSGSTVAGFNMCKKCYGNTAAESTKYVANCYVDGGTAQPVGNTSAGGWNN